MALETILYEKKEGVGTVKLNRPERKNTLNLQLIDEMTLLLDDIARDGDIKVVVITGGQECFSAGADLKEFSFNDVPAIPINEMLSLFKKLENLEKPVIAAISGPCLAGGCMIAMMCDLRIASETAVFGLPEIKFGVVASFGATQRLPQTIGVAKAKEMYYTGDSIDAQEAFRIGLVNKVVPVQSLIDEAMKMANTLADRSTAALRVAKALINASMGVDLDTAMDLELKGLLKLASEPETKEALKRAAKREDIYRKLLD